MAVRKFRRWKPLGPPKSYATWEEALADRKREAELREQVEERIENHPKDGAFGYRREKDR